MIEVVCGVLRDESGRILACRRAAGKHLAGLWEFPGGKIEDGETAEAALARELEEELGVVVKVGEALGVVEWAYEGREIRLRPFFCQLVEGAAAALEHEEIRWCKMDDLRALDWAAADLPILEELFSRNC